MIDCFILYDIVVAILEQMKPSKEQKSCFLLGFFIFIRKMRFVIWSRSAFFRDCSNIKADVRDRIGMEHDIQNGYHGDLRELKIGRGIVF